MLGYDAGIMTVILANKQFISYYNMDANKTGLVATIPWASTGLAQLFLGGTLASYLGRLWALRLSIMFMILGVCVVLASSSIFFIGGFADKGNRVVQVVPNTFAVLLVGRLMTCVTLVLRSLLSSAAISGH